MGSLQMIDAYLHGWSIETAFKNGNNTRREKVLPEFL
jgi:hypothetical protein